MNLSRREKIIGLVASVVVGGLMLDQLLVSPMLERLDNATAMIQQHQEDLQKAESVFSSDLAARKRWKQMVGNGFKTDASAAEGQLLDRVRDAAQRSGIGVQAFKPERSEKVNGFYRITIRVTATGNASQTVRFLYLLQTSTIPLKVMDLQISSRKDGTDDLAIQMGISTIFDAPVQKVAMRDSQREVIP
ncbi:MAG: hypothetical protein KatS3mg104_1936 [Phycisphaerae bacterium]|jgi:hypothetical protein|nr:MAG: hypothetical protein KatS3mg104_1936 [Phycisphaerae bacterium]